MSWKPKCPLKSWSFPQDSHGISEKSRSCVSRLSSSLTGSKLHQWGSGWPACRMGFHHSIITSSPQHQEKLSLCQWGSCLCAQCCRGRLTDFLLLTVYHFLQRFSHPPSLPFSPHVSLPPSSFSPSILIGLIPWIKTWHKPLLQKSWLLYITVIICSLCWKSADGKYKKSSYEKYLPCSRDVAFIQLYHKVSLNGNLILYRKSYIIYIYQLNKEKESSFVKLSKKIPCNVYGHLFKNKCFKMVLTPGGGMELQRGHDLREGSMRWDRLRGQQHLYLLCFSEIKVNTNTIQYNIILYYII